MLREEKKQAPGKRMCRAANLGSPIPQATGETSETCEASSTIISNDFPGKNFRMERGWKLSQPPNPEMYNHIPPLGGGC